MECLTCPSVLTKFNTKDWAGEGGHCDACNEQQADQALDNYYHRLDQYLDYIS